MIRRGDDGFTVIELLVTISIFAVVSLGFYQVMFAGTRGTETSGSVVDISEEARLGLNRIVRDTREALVLVNATPTSYRVQINFDGDANAAESPNENGDYEDITFTFSGDKILLGIPDVSGGLINETLIEGVDCVNGARKSDGTCVTPVFSYSSAFLEYDSDGDGVTEESELDAASFGDKDGKLTSSNKEITYVTSVDYAFQITSGNRTTVFYSEAQMRNLRGART